MKDQFQGSYIKGNVNTLLTCHTFAFWWVEANFMCMTVLLVPIDISKYTYGQMDFARNGLKKHVYLQTIRYESFIKSGWCNLFIYKARNQKLTTIYIDKCHLDVNVI